MMPEDLTQVLNELIDYLESLSVIQPFIDSCLNELENEDEDKFKHLEWLLRMFKAELDLVSDDGVYRAKLLKRLLEQKE